MRQWCRLVRGLPRHCAVSMRHVCRRKLLPFGVKAVRSLCGRLHLHILEWPVMDIDVCQAGCLKKSDSWAYFAIMESSSGNVLNRSVLSPHQVGWLARAL